MISGEERRICNLEAMVEKLEKDIWEIKYIRHITTKNIIIDILKNFFFLYKL